MEEKYLEDLKDIKDIMVRSSRFISLSGLSGISAGLFALIGAFMAYRVVYDEQEYMGYRSPNFDTNSLRQLLIIAVATLLLALISGIFFTIRETKKSKQKIWDLQTKRLLINLMIPLITGGLLCTILMFHDLIGLIAPLTLIFYGLALVNASKYTLTEIRSLGLLEIGLGLISLNFIGYGLIFWAFGFGLLHIVYGTIMHYRYRA